MNATLLAKYLFVLMAKNLSIAVIVSKGKKTLRLIHTQAHVQILLKEKVRN